MPRRGGNLRRRRELHGVFGRLPERLDRSDLFTDQGYIGDGYGIPTAGGMEAIALLAKTEAIVLDPCYTSKAMAALIDHVRKGVLRPDQTVVFLHTGGMPAIFTWNENLLAQAMA